METFFLKSIKDAIKYWYIPLIVGLLFVIVSVVAFVSPEASFLALSILLHYPFY